MAVREALYAVVESALGTAKTSPVVGTDAWYFNLPDSDAFTGVMTPVFQEIPLGSGVDVPFDVKADHHVTALNWKGFVYPGSRSQFLINLALQRIDSGQTSPWTTTEQPDDLASASLYHLWLPRGQTAVRKRFAGCKIATLELSCSRQDPKLRFTATLQGKREVGNTVDSSSDPDATEFPAPTDTQLPTGPYLFSHSSGAFYVGGSAVTNYDSVSLKVTNKLDVLTLENEFPTVIACLGQEIELTFRRILNTSANYRTFLQGVTDKAAYLKFDNGTNTFKIDMGSSNYVKTYQPALGLGKVYMETVTLRNRWNASAGTNVTLTFT